MNKTSFKSKLLIVLLVTTCSRGAPSLEIFQNGEWVLIGPVEISSLEGKRDGSEVHATGVFTLGSDQMRLDMKLVLLPQAVFIQGTHDSIIQGKAIKGLVTAESVTFLGGQSDSPSIGGVFVLKHPSSKSSYRLNFPPTIFGN